MVMARWLKKIWTTASSKTIHLLFVCKHLQCTPRKTRMPPANLGSLWVQHGLKPNVSQEILRWHSLRHSHSADICIHFYCLSWLRQASNVRPVLIIFESARENRLARDEFMKYCTCLFDLNYSYNVYVASISWQLNSWLSSPGLYYCFAKVV